MFSENYLHLSCIACMYRCQLMASVTTDFSGQGIARFKVFSHENNESKDHARLTHLTVCLDPSSYLAAKLACTRVRKAMTL